MNDLLTIKNYVVEKLSLPCEQIGTWLWVGNTQDKRKIEVLTNNGFEYSNIRKLYYLRPISTKYLKYKSLSMQELRDKYNNKQINLFDTPIN